MHVELWHWCRCWCCCCWARFFHSSFNTQHIGSSISRYMWIVYRNSRTIIKYIQNNYICVRCVRAWNEWETKMLAQWVCNFPQNYNSTHCFSSTLHLRRWVMANQFWFPRYIYIYKLAHFLLPACHRRCSWCCCASLDATNAKFDWFSRFLINK